ncbi:MAG: hypothetical protein KJO09_00190 [Gammaproteobacteria bacterium]|nr:hypothetical protein [Gammaproteobacteria bacterium]
MNRKNGYLNQPQRNDMHFKKIAITGIALFALSQPASAGIYDDLDEHGNKQVSGQYSFDVFVQCLNGGAGDFLYVDVDYHLVIHSRTNGPTWMFSAQWRQSGTAYDLSGNTWTFNGHWKVNETTEDPDWWNRAHITVVETDVFVADGDAPNLKLSFTREVRWRDGEEVLRDRDLSVTCLNDNSRRPQ